MDAKRAAAAVGVLAALALTACGESAGESATSATPEASETTSRASTFDVAGTLTLTDRDGFHAYGRRAGADCTGDSGYDDIREGVAVLIRNSRGEQIALGRLGAGYLTEKMSSYVARCEFAFSIPGVEEDGEIYSVEVGHRGEVPFERENAAQLALSLG